jgi:hypothetical protein
VARNLGLDEVVDYFTLVGDEGDQLHNKTGATRLGLALALNFPALAGPVPEGTPRAARRRGGACRPPGGRAGGGVPVL